MDSLLVINSENKNISQNVLDYLDKNYQIDTASSHEQAMAMLDQQFFDLFLVIATEIDQDLIRLFDEIKRDRGDLLPVVISLSQITERSQAQAFRQRALYLIEHPLDLEKLKKELASVSEILTLASHKVMLLSTRKYDKAYRVKQVIYIERSRPKYIRICYEEGNGEISNEEVFFKASLEKFIEKHGLSRYFIQVHQSYLVNPRFIKYIDKVELEIMLTNEKKLPLGLTYYNKMKKGVEDDD